MIWSKGISITDLWFLIFTSSVCFCSRICKRMRGAHWELYLTPWLQPPLFLVLHLPLTLVCHLVRWRIVSAVPATLKGLRLFKTVQSLNFKPIQLANDHTCSNRFNLKFSDGKGILLKAHVYKHNLSPIDVLIYRKAFQSAVSASELQTETAILQHS